MISNFNSWHPMPRFGLAAALQYLGKYPKDAFSVEDLTTMVTIGIRESLNRFMLKPNLSHGKVNYTYLTSDQINPGKSTGQNAENGFYIAPHILTGNNATGILKEAKNLIARLQEVDHSKSYELKRSFAPMVAKINAGNASMANPKVSLLQAAFTAYASLTELKPAAYQGSNTALIPDIPFFDAHTQSFPLFSFIGIYKKLQQQGTGDEAFTSKYNDKKFSRPPIFKGNYPEAPQSFHLGAVPVIAAIGKWVEKQKIQRKDAIETLKWLENRPIHIISEINLKQEYFNHHLIELALNGELHTIIQNLYKVTLMAIEDSKKFNDNRWKLFVMHFDQFLRFFSRASFQNFLSYHATYPIEFFTLLKTYFMNEQKYPKEYIEAAVIYGQSINRAAYFTAKSEDEEDVKKGRKGRGVKEYKHRVLLQLESIIQSAKSNSELIARLNIQVGRLTMQDIPIDAKPFLLAAMNDQIELEDTRNFIMAFMRLSSLKSSSSSNLEEHYGNSVPPAPSIQN